MNNHATIRIAHPAELGAAAWVAYGLIEYLDVQILPMAFQEVDLHTYWHAVFDGLLFCFYLAVGVLVGGFAGLLIRVAERSGYWPKRFDPSDSSFVASAGSVLLCVSAMLYHRIYLDVAQILTLAALGGILLWILFFPRKSIRPKRLFDGWGILFAGIWLVTTLWSAFYPPTRDSTAKIAAFGIQWIGLSVILARLVNLKPLSRQHTFRSSRSSIAVAILFLVGIVGIDLFRIQSLDFGPLNRTVVQHEPVRPNILLIVLDTVRADHLGLYGYWRNTTPHLNRLAEQATVYDFAVSPGDMTLTSHGAIFTGLYGRQTGAHYDDKGYPQALRPEFTTIAEYLRGAGYTTVAIVSNSVFFGQDFGLEQGFDYSDARPTEEFVLYKSLGHADPLFLRKAIHGFLVRGVSPSKSDREFRSANLITKEALKFIDAHSGSGNPFFLFLNYMDSHVRYMPPEPYDRFYPGKIEDFTLKSYQKLVHEVTKTHRRAITKPERDHLESQYDGSINYSDVQIQKIIDRLKEKKLFDDMLIIVTSDHGEAFGDRHLIQHAVSAYQDQLSVPLLIHYPNGEHQGRIGHWVSTLDIMPTILAISGLEIPEGISGISLIGGNPPEGRILVGESYYNNRFMGNRFARIERAVYQRPYKLIRSTTGKHELYDLAQDPKETTDLYRQNAAAATALEAQLENWLAATPDIYDNLEETKPEDRTVERLRTLGYLN